MIAHTSVNVSNFEKSKEFYKQALKPLGYELIMDLAEYKVAGFGVKGNPDFWIHGAEEFKQPTHVAFVAGSKEEVHKFYDAAMAAGGADNGVPEYCPEYHPGYYGGFVFDPDKNNIEAVFNDPSKL